MSHPGRCSARPGRFLLHARGSPWDPKEGCGLVGMCRRPFLVVVLLGGLSMSMVWWLESTEVRFRGCGGCILQLS